MEDILASSKVTEDAAYAVVGVELGQLHQRFKAAHKVINVTDKTLKHNPNPKLVSTAENFLRDTVTSLVVSAIWKDGEGIDK